MEDSFLMKRVIKRYLFIGFSLVLAALTARRFNKETETEAALPPGDSGDGPDHSGTPAPVHRDQPRSGDNKPGDQPSNQPGRISPRGPATAPSVTFSGTVVRNGPRFALRETAGVLYPLDSAGRAWPYEGEDVRVTGKLDLDTRLLYVDAIEPEKVA
jgi:hypothetical protein